MLSVVHNITYFKTSKPGFRVPESLGPYLAVNTLTLPLTSVTIPFLKIVRNPEFTSVRGIYIYIYICVCVCVLNMYIYIYIYIGGVVG
jgi:hypothetical protein